MVIIETPIFTRRVQELLSDEEYRQLQLAIASQPEVGPILRGSGGIRKLRWSAQGRGRRGGVRVIYYWAVAQDQILMLFIYPKNEQDTLSQEQLRLLKSIVEEDYP
jgi:mRNA-degrading endonuclease RelE of RelBE toxin-antitoxin system